MGIKRIAFITASLIVFIFALVIITHADSGIGSIVTSFDSPEDKPCGLAWQGSGSGYIWVACRSNDRIYQCRTNGSVIRNFRSGHSGFTYGLAAGQIGGTWYIWSLGYNPGLIRRFTTSGTQVGSFPVYANPPAGYPYGLTFRSTTYLYESGWNCRRIFHMHSTTGSVYGSFPVPSTLWVVRRASTGPREVHKVDLSGSFITSFNVAGYGDPSGCAFDGNNVWISFTTPTNMVIAFTGGYTSVSPLSLGRVKALFK
jgi:hypothetical protein